MKVSLEAAMEDVIKCVCVFRPARNCFNIFHSVCSEIIIVESNRYRIDIYMVWDSMSILYEVSCLPIQYTLLSNSDFENN